MRAKAFSYARWSTDRQTAGDSLRRQRELSAKYAADHDLDLDESLKDEGVSAYHGMNRHRGDLSIFLDQIESGIIPRGSYLLLESLDRISREQIVEAQTLFLRIINAGITIVTCLPHRQTVYSREIINKDPTLTLMAAFEMIRANEDSAHKAERVKAARKWGRDEARLNGRTFTKNLPAWISFDAEGNRVLNHKAKIVREIFEMTAAGIGRHKIVNILNQRKVEPFGKGHKPRNGAMPPKLRGWHASHVHHLIHGRTVLGELQPHTITVVDGNRVRTPEGGPIPNYYEAAVDEDLYYRAHAATAKNHMGVGRKGKRFNNLLTAGITRCEVCNSHMAFQDKGAKSVPNYVCSAAVRKVCTNTKKYRHSRFEEAILHHVAEIHVDKVKPPEDRTLEIDLAALIRRKGTLQNENENFYAQMGSGLKGVAAQISKREAEIEAIDGQIASLRATIASRAFAPSIQERLDFIAEVRETMKTGTDEEIYLKRSQVALALREIVTDVVFYPQGHADLIVLNGMAAYRIDPKKPVDEAWVRIGDKPGYAPVNAFTHGDEKVAEKIRRVIAA